MLKIKNIRNIIQSLGILFMVYLVIATFMGKGLNLHRLCPYSVVCFGVSSFIGKLSISPFMIAFIASSIILLLTLFLGRFFCGWLCPLGTIQEFLFKIGKKKKLSNQNKYDSFHRIMSKVKYLILLAHIVLAYNMVNYIFINKCPIIAVANFKLLGGIAVNVILILLASLFIERFFCRYICPYAALMNIMQFIGKVLRIPRLKITVNKEACVDCKICNKSCPMQIDISKKAVINDPNCIICGRCKTACPKEDGISFKIKK